MTTATRERTTDLAAGAAEQAAPARARDPWFDNAKMLLVTLVVVGHGWTLLPETASVSTLYNWLYLWHMPAFVVVTGYLSRSFAYSRRQLRRLVTAVLLPYLVFEGLLGAFRVLVGGERLERLWLNPHWAMWFLVALLCWRLVTPVLLRWRWARLAALGGSFAGGMVSVETLDLTRVLGLLPFFVLGLALTPQTLELVRSVEMRLAGLLVLLAGVPVAEWVEQHLRTEWLYYRSSYAELGVGALEGAVTRLVLVTVAVLMMTAVLAWVPRSASWWTRMGAASFVVYLFHTFVVKGAEYAGIEGWAASRPALSLAVATGGAVLLALGLAAPPVARRLQPLVTPLR